MDRAWRSSRWWLVRVSLCALLGQLAVSLARPVVSYRAITLGADAFEIGVVTAAYGLLPAVAAVAVGRWSDRTTRVTVVVAGGVVLLVASMAIAAASPGLAVLSVAAALMGVGNLVLLLGAQALITRSAPASDLDQGFGWLTAAMSVGQSAGPLAAGLVLTVWADSLVAGTAVAFGVAAGVALAAVLPLVRYDASGRHARSRPDSGGGRVSSASIVRRPGMIPAMFVSMALLSAADLLTAYLPLLADDQGIAPGVVGVLLAVRAGASTVSRLLLGPLSRRWSRTALVVASTAGTAISLAVLPATSVVAVMGAILIVGGFLLGLGQPLTMTFVAAAAPEGGRATALALRLLGNRIAQVAVPALAGVVAGTVGVAGALWLQSALLFAATGAGRALRAEPPGGLDDDTT